MANPAIARRHSPSPPLPRSPHSRVPRPPTPPRPRPRRSSDRLDVPFVMAAARASQTSSSSSSQKLPTNSSLDLGYLAQYDYDARSLTEAADLSSSGVEIDLIGDGGEGDPLPTPAPTLGPSASEMTLALGTTNGIVENVPTLSNSTGQADTPKRRPTRTPTTRTVSSQQDPSQQLPERRVRHTPHLPSGSAPRVPPTAMYWSRAPVHGVLPRRKFRAHTVTLVDGHEAWIFGGCDAVGCSADVYVLDTETFAWSAPELAGEAPPPCRAHSATLVDGKRIFVFGGGAASEYYDSLWVLDTHLRSWARIEVEGPKPTQRRAHTAVLYKGKIVVFGGGNGARALNDVWQLDVNSMSWELLETNGKKPAPRGYHTANVVGANMVVVGGSDGKTCFPDVWVLNLDTLSWRLCETDKVYRRLSHCATQVGSYLFVFSGHDSQKYSNDLLLFNLITLQWEARQVAGRPPSVRAYQACFLTDSRFFVLGGFDGSSTYDDVHILDLAASAYLPQVTSFSMS